MAAAFLAKFGALYSSVKSNYDLLTNKPQINGVSLEGNKTTADLNIPSPEISAVRADDKIIVTITHTDGSTSVVEVYDGQTGATGPQGQKGDTGEAGATGATGATGNGIASIKKTSTSGNFDTYTITYTDGTTTTFDIANGEAVRTTRNLNTTGCGRYSANINNGVIAATGDSAIGMTDKVPCKPETTYTVSLRATSPATLSAFICFYDAYGAFISYTREANLSAASLTATFTTPAEAAYMYVHFYRGAGITYDDYSAIQVEEGTEATIFIEPVVAYDQVARQGAIEAIPITETAGYWTASGTISQASSNAEKYTDLIDLSLYTGMQYELHHSTARSMWLAVAVFDGHQAFLSRITLKENTGGTTQTDFGSELRGLPAAARYVSFCYRTYGDATFTVKATTTAITALNRTSEAVNLANAVLNKINGTDLYNAANPLRFKACYDHLFVRDTAGTVIPHESLYHVRLSRRMGFNIIEANIQTTSDGVFVVNHGSAGAFGGYFQHVDGTTDISSTLISSVTWDWIEQNIRYISSIPKYRTRPARLEEFLAECKQQGIIPFVTSSDPAVIALVEAYMGKNNYIAYNATRANAPQAIIYHWVTRTTKEDILAYCETVGKPFIYGMANPTAFTDEELRDIVETLHAAGYWIGTSYVDDTWYKYAYLGFDFNGTQTRINRLINGNVCNIDSNFGFDQFAYTGATESDGVLTFSTDGSLTPAFSASVLPVGGFDLEICFSGTITVPRIGEHATRTYTSDGSYPVFIAAPIINRSCAATLTVSAGTVVTDCCYKVSRF